MNNKHLYLLAFLLTVAGLVPLWYKWAHLGLPLTPETATRHWEIEARVRFVAQGGPVKVSMFLPRYDPRWPILDEGFISRGFGLVTERVNNQRVATWSIRRGKGQHTLYYQGKFFSDLSTAPTRAPRPDPPLTPPEVAPPAWSGARKDAAEALLAQVRQTSADTPTLVSGILKVLGATPVSDQVKVLLGNRRTRLNRMLVAVELLAALGISAQVTHGIQLDEATTQPKIESWLEVWQGKSWRAYPPKPPDETSRPVYMAWWSGPDPLVTVSGGRNVDAVITINKVSDAGLAARFTVGDRQGPLLTRFSLLSLPLDTQLLYRVLLMVPVGAFLIVLIRNVIGFKTLGTFMPVLIAMAFREVNLLEGVILFIIVVLGGLAVRFYFEQLKLLLVPRLASVMTVVVLLMVALSVLSHNLGLQAGLSVGLFPMVILTMTIERLTVVWDERGAGEAFQQGSGSLVAAIAAYFLMNLDWIQHIAFVFPESLLVLLAGTMLLGRYSGYRLTELPRFRALAGSDT